MEFNVSEIPAELLFFIFFATWTEYRIHRFRKFLFSGSGIIKHQAEIFFALVTLAGAVFFLLKLDTEIQYAIVIPAIITIFYSLPVMRTAGKTYGLREIPYVKTFIISIIWSYVCVWLPVLASNIQAGIHEVLIAVCRFFFILALTIPFDVRDSVFDRSAGVRSIGQLAHADRMYKTAALLLIPACLVPAYFYTLQNMLFTSTAYLVSGMLSAGILLNRKLRSSPDFHLLYVDGMIALQGLLVLASVLFNLGG